MVGEVTVTDGTSAVVIETGRERPAEESSETSSTDTAVLRELRRSLTSAMNFKPCDLSVCVKFWKTVAACQWEGEAQN